jgi:hypothetical protein
MKSAYPPITALTFLVLLYSHKSQSGENYEYQVYDKKAKISFKCPILHVIFTRFICEH